MRDRCSRVPRREAEAVHGLRRERGWGPQAWALHAPSTAYSRAGPVSTARPDAVSARSCVSAAAGRLLHLDVKKLARPPGGGKRARSPPSGPKGVAVDCVHVAVDDRSRYAYAEALPDERGVTTAGFLERAIARFAGRRAGQRGAHRQR